MDTDTLIAEWVDANDDDLPQHMRFLKQKLHEVLRDRHYYQTHASIRYKLKNKEIRKYRSTKEFDQMDEEQSEQIEKASRKRSCSYDYQEIFGILQAELDYIKKEIISYIDTMPPIVEEHKTIKLEIPEKPSPL